MKIIERLILVLLPIVNKYIFHRVQEQDGRESSWLIELLTIQWSVDGCLLLVPAVVGGCSAVVKWKINFINYDHDLSSRMDGLYSSYTWFLDGHRRVEWYAHKTDHFNLRNTTAPTRTVTKELLISDTNWFKIYFPSTVLKSNITSLLL